MSRLLRRLAAPGITPLRPVAGIALSLGIVLMVVGTTIPAAVPADPNEAFSTQLEAVENRDNGAAAPEVPVPAAGEGAAGGEEAPPAAKPDDALRTTDAAEVAAEPAIARDILIYAGLLVALLSFAVLALVTVARRRWRDPLLR